ncbi:MAG: tRNA (adenosine(37)-N6)-threonylcarbamoyltransferase complex ATPase subunit type 1 TsaE [Bacteroidales bacterium]|nr:tRNA (adenosine(37)-N6)-threonylcarbamoyltransferase complex ATPase subunit type 1 TsaE [Bacteroidales bacterium]
MYICRVKHEILIPSLDGIDQAAREFLKQTAGYSMIAFYAPMGAGKTTFTAALCRVLGVSEDTVNSPTFSIVNEYLTDDGKTVYHFDFYRISKIAEALDIGLYEYLDSGNLCLMEWPENIEDILPEETLKVNINVNPDQSRTICWED